MVDRQWKQRRLELPGVEVAAQVWGPQQGRKVLALHGWLDNAASFEALVPLLGDGLQVVAVDLPGHGLSSGYGPGHSYHFIDWPAVVLQVAEALKWETFGILGHSMGGAIAALTAPIAGGRVERMVWLDALGPWTSPPQEVVTNLARSVAEEALRQGQQERRRYDSVEAMLKVLGKSRTDVSQERLRLLVKRGAVRDGSGRWIFSYDRKLRLPSRVRLSEGQVLAFLEAIECPVLLVRPRWGWPVKEEVMSRRIAAVKGLEVIEVEGGHHLHLEAPERINEAVGNFLRAQEQV